MNEEISEIAGRLHGSIRGLTEIRIEKEIRPSSVNSSFQFNPK